MWVNSLVGARNIINEEEELTGFIHRRFVKTEVQRMSKVGQQKMERLGPKLRRTEMQDEGIEEFKFKRPAIQQDNNYEEFMKWILNGGLRYAVAKQNGLPADKLYQKKVDPDQQRHVIVVGAGMAGLSAAYELAQIGHKVTILEAQSRVGGRVKTFREGLADGLHAEAGAMRIPPNHYLTHHYIDLFNVETRPFQNYNKNGYIYMYDEKITMEEFEKNNKYYTDKWWPGWDANLTPEFKKEHKIEGILSLYKLTVEPVKSELGKNPTEKQWQSWVEKWSKLSLDDFLRSTIYQLEEEPKFRPWPEQAIQAYLTATYTPMQTHSLVNYLREELGEWWKDPLITPTQGMDSIPKAFIKKNDNGWNKDVDLSTNIVYGAMVEKVEEVGKRRVKVSGINKHTGAAFSYEGDAVFLTVTLPILRQLDVPLPKEKQQALANITYDSSTKIMLQCKTRFWQKEVGQGGFSKTNLQIGQLHYPDYDGSGIGDEERGVLMVYTWGINALTFGGEKDTFAIMSAVHQISKIHPEIYDQFEVGMVQAWQSDPAFQAAFAALLPYEYLDAFKTLTTPTKTMYLAGEALSWSNGWIQGAIFSGLMQAFCFQELNESGSITPPVEYML